MNLYYVYAYVDEIEEFISYHERRIRNLIQDFCLAETRGKAKYKFQQFYKNNDNYYTGINYTDINAKLVEKNIKNDDQLKKILESIELNDLFEHGYTRNT